MSAEANRWHWPEYLCEAAGLALFMLAACVFTALLEHPASVVHNAMPSPLARRVVMGVAMGLTSLAIVCSRLGKRSGAHLNPALTLSFLTLGKVRGSDAVFYSVFQVIGGAVGVLAGSLLVGPALSHSAVRYAATVPGSAGIYVAFAAEAIISFVLMMTVLVVSNNARLSKWTPVFAAVLIATWITFEAPFSGMSMNPARTAASAFHASVWTAWWVYFTAPPLAMLAAAWVYRSRYGIARVYCAKLHHHNSERCIFRCNYGAMRPLVRRG